MARRRIRLKRGGLFHRLPRDMTLFTRLFPETLFPRKLSAAADKRARLVRARADEALMQTHAANALLFVDALASEVGYERALQVYVREMEIPEPAASVITTRALAALGEAFVPTASERLATTAYATPIRRPRLTNVEPRSRQA